MALSLTFSSMEMQLFFSWKETLNDAMTRGSNLAHSTGKRHDLLKILTSNENLCVSAFGVPHIPYHTFRR